MKTTKKALSVLLAVIMIMSSMSVCFGVEVFAANDTGAINAFVSAVQCDAMKNFPTLTKVETNNGKSGENKIIYKTFTYETDNYAYYEQVVNVITKLDAAIKGLDEYKNGHAHNNNSNCQDGWGKTTATDKCTDLGWIERHLKLAIGDATLATLNGTYHLDRLFAAVFNMDGTTDKRNADNDIDMNDQKNKIESSIQNILIVRATKATTKLTSYASIDAIPDNLAAEYKYQLNMTRKNYTTKGGFLNLKTINHYHFALSSSEDAGKIFVPAETGGTISTNKSVLTTAQSTFNSYSNYLNAADVNAVLAISTDATTLTNAYDAINTQRNNVVNNFDQATLTKFFPKVDTALKNISDAIDFLAFESLADEIKALYGVDFSRMNESETLAHLTAFRTKWAEFTKLEQATQDLVASTYNIDVDAIEERIQEISDRYDSFRIRNLKATIDTHINMYEYLDIDDVDNAADPAAIKSTIFTAIATLYNDLNSLNSYDAALVAEVCGAGYKASVQARYDELSDLGVAANLNEDYMARYMAFVNDIQPATADGVDNATVRDTLKNYDAWTVELKNLINSMKDILGAEDAQKLYDEVDGVMKDYMAAAYVALNARVEAEIETAWGLYQGFKAQHKLTGIDFTNISAYNQLKTSIGLIDTDAYEFLKVSQNIRISQDAINKYNELVNFAVPGYQEFLDSFGFSNYNQTKIPDLVREESTDDIAREGTYTTTDADIEKIITKIDALLNNAEVKKLLGQLLNKNEDGTWNGKSFDLGAMLTDLIKGALFTDGMINTVAGMLYPLVVTEFIKVWANDLPAKNGDFAISYIKDLYTIFKEAGFNVYPDLLASKLDSSKYKTNIDILKAATNNFKAANGNQYYTLKLIDEYKDDGTQKKGADKTPWDEAVLKKNVIDEETGEVVLNDDGTPKTEWALDWGVDAYKEKIEADGVVTAEEQAAFEAKFYEAFDDAVEGLKPLLLALLGNKAWAPSEVDHIADTKHKVGITLDVEVGLKLGATANRGYANLIIPVYEALGITGFKSASTLEGYSNNTNAAADILKGILDPIFNFANTTLKNAPLTTILNLLPNLAYALITDMVPELLDMLKTSITYKAVPYIIGGWIDVSSFVDISGGADISVGSMLDLKSLGVDLSDGLNTLLPGFGLNIPKIDQGKLATMGTLGQINTGRAEAIYTQPAAGKAYHINANKADVLLFLLDYALSSGLLGQFITVPEEEGLVRDLLTNLMNPENTDNVLAALVELLNAKAYNTLENYEWYHGYIDNVEVGTITDPAVQVYMNPGNDWTEDKAQYLYDNIDAIVGAILKTANVDLDDTTEEVDGSIGKLIGGIFSAKTLTSIARLLGSISDINALIEGIGAETEETETPDASEPETVEEGEDATEGEEDENGATAAPALDIDVNALIKEFLGVDLKTAFGKYAEIPTAEENPDYIYDFGKEIKTASDFAAVLSEMLAPLNPVLGFILDGKNLTLTIKEAVKDETGAVVTPAETVELIGYNGYDSAIVPLLEALGCDAKAYEDGKALELTLTALATKIDALVNGGTVKGIIDILPGLFYFLAGNNLSTVVRNLLQPVYVILDTIRPIYNLDLAELLAGIEINGAPLGLDLDTLNLNFVFDLIKKFIPAEIDLGTLLDDVKELIYSICKIVGKEYKSVSALAGQTTWKRGEYGEFSQADMLTVILSFVLEWATVEDNAEKLDALLNTDGVIASLNTVFADVEITYGTPNWMYWFETEAEFNEYVEGEKALPNTLAALEYPDGNDWDLDTAKYFAENIDVLVDKIIAMINEGKTDEEGNALPTTLADLLSGLVYDNLGGYFTAETIKTLIGYISGVLANVDDTLLNVGYELLGVNLVALKNYTCEAEINDLASFVAELARILDSYAKPIVDLLFFGDDIRLAKKSDKTDTIVINGGKGYEKGLAIILEALGCKNLPEVKAANATNVLKSLTDRVDEILENPVNEILDLLPNLIYALNADAVGVAVNNLLGPVNALLDKINDLGLLENEIDLNALLTIKVKDENGNEVEKAILQNLKLANVVEIVEGATGLPLDAAEAILVNFCTGKITKGQFGYKMAAAREDVITILLVVALELISDKDFAEKLDEMLGTDFIAKIKEIFAPSKIEYAVPDWNYAAVDNGTVDAMKYSITYPNNWTEKTAKYVTELLLSDEFDALIASLIEDGKYATISELLKDKVNIFTTDTLNSLLDMIKNLLGGVDAKLLELGFILDVKLDKLVKYEVKKDIDTVQEFADELAYILGEFAPGVVEWLLLGRDFKLLVKDDDGIGEGLDGEAYITISGAEGYKKGLAILLEALGCENLPSAVITEENTTAKIIEGVLTSLANRIDEILNNPIVEVIDLLPNLFYFLNTNGVAAVIKNTTAALTALSAKINVFVDVNLDVASMVNLKELLKLPEEAKLSMTNLSMAAVLEAVGMLVGLDLTKAEKVLVDFALGKFEAYTSVSGDADAKKMVYADEFDKHDLVTVVANLALLVLADEANAEFVKGLVGEEVYDVILNVLQIKEAELKKMSWQHTDKVGESFNAMTSSENYKGYGYGPRYTEEMADYIAENIGEFVDNIIYLLGIEIEGKSVESLEEILKNLVNGNLYNSANIVAIRDALAGLLDKIAGLEVNGVVVGGYIVDVLKTSLGVDVTAVAKVEVPEFTEDKVQFVTYLGKVVDPLGPILNWILTDKDIAFFAKEGENGKPTDFIKLPGAEGYKNGIVLLLEALGCKDIVAPADLEGASGSAIVTAIAEPLLNRLDEIINNPAEELLAVLPNLIYFINSNGVDVVVKNTLNAVYTILNAIEPIAKIDLYELIGLDLETLTFEKLIDMLLKDLEIAGFKFTEIPMDTFVELTVGKLETYDSLSAEDPAYRMVYDENSASEGDMVTVLLRLVITFILTENNREVLINLLKSELGMSADAEKYVAALFKALADCTIGNQLGMDSALATIYYVYYGLDKGVGEAADGKKDLDKAWQAKLKELGYSDNKDEQSVGNLITDILDIVFNDQGNVPDDGGNDVLDKDGLASNGFLSFFQRIKIFFEEIAAFFRELFSFGK